MTETGVPLVHYISLDHESKAVVLTCRGTLGFEDVLTDMTCEYDDLTWRGRQYTVHKGIHASARRLLEGRGGQVLATIKKALNSQLTITGEVVNPFAYARQLVQDKTGTRRTTFFFPHNSDAAPWWQGENARLASLAAVAYLAAKQFPDDPEFQKKLRAFATNQLNWILGLNPFDSSMMNGVGRNNPQYLFFDSWEFTNAPGGISNGITSGFRDEEDIDYNLTYKQTGADNDWRWQEQWLPHASWYLLAVSAQ